MPYGMIFEDTFCVLLILYGNVFRTVLRNLNFFLLIWFVSDL